MLTCKETEKMVMPYIKEELDENELDEFMRHILACPSCREELEIYYTVMLGLKQLDYGTGAYDISRTLEENLEFSQLKLKTIKVKRIIIYAVDTLVAVWLFAAIFLWVRMWLEKIIF